MNAEVFRRVGWKEYRTLRGLWILLALLAVLIQLLVYSSRVMVDGPKASNPVELYAIALVFMALFALGASVILFAIEREEGTSDFLRALPADPRGLFVPKVVAALVGLFSLGAALALSTTALVAVLSSTQQLDRHEMMMLISQLGLTPFEVLAWGILFSMITRRTVVAACLGTAAASAAIHISAKFVAPNAWLMKDLHPYAAAVFPYRLSFLALAIGIDVWLSRRWLRILPLEDWFGVWRTRRESTKVVDAAVELREAQPKPSQVVALRRLTWQAFRLGRTPMVALIGVSALLILFLASLNDAYDAPSDRTSWAAVVAAIVVSLAGSCVFLADHQGQRFRYFSERPVSATALWLSRQLCWLSVVGVAVVVGVAWWAYSVVPDLNVLTQPSERGYYGRASVAIYSGTLGEMPAWLAFAVFMLLAFSAGQLCSMFLRSGILSAVLAVVLCGLLSGWVALQESFGVSWLLSAAPLMLIAFFVSWLRTRDWIGERTGPRAWARAGLSVVLPLGTMIAVLAYCRVESVPDVEPGFSLADYAAQSTPEARETTAIYTRAGELLTLANGFRLNEINEITNKIINQQTADGLPAEAELAAAREQEVEVWRDYVQKNPSALELFVQASARSHGAPSLSAPLYDDQNWRAMQGERLLLKDAAFLTRAGNLDTALARIIAALRVHVHLLEHRIYGTRTNTVRDAMSQLMDWSIAPGQTPERIREAIAALATWEKSLPSPDDQLMALYEWSSTLLSNEPQLRGKGRWGDWFDNARGTERIALRLFPWERARAQRVLNLLTAEDLRRSQQFFNATGGSKALDRARLGWESSHSIGPWMRSTTLLRSISMNMLINDRDWASRISTVTLVGSTQIRLALVAWQIEHGELPASLSELVGPYFEQLPIDPDTGGEYRYFPKGVQTELRWNNVGRPEDLAVGTPLLWSPGGLLVFDQNPANAPLRQYLPIDARRYGPRPEYGWAINEIQALQRGLIMPIPRPR